MIMTALPLPPRRGGDAGYWALFKGTAWHCHSNSATLQKTLPTLPRNCSFPARFCDPACLLSLVTLRHSLCVRAVCMKWLPPAARHDIVICDIVTLCAQEIVKRHVFGSQVRSCSPS